MWQVCKVLYSSKLSVNIKVVHVEVLACFCLQK